jgi:glycogen debranching enzyme
VTSALASETRPNDASEDAPVSQYRIAANATLQERRTRTLKHGDTFAVFDHRGDIGSEPGSSEGLYTRDTRILSEFVVLLEEARPLLLSSTIQDDNATFSADLSNPDLLVGDVVAL